MPAWLRRSLAAKLLVAELLIVLAGAGTLLLVSVAVGPGVFHRHVRDALGVVPADVARHLDIAFEQATLISLGIAVAAAVATALAVSWFVSQRVARPIGSLALSAREVARGAYDTRVPVSGEDELAQLGTAFNEMAAALAASESRRRALLADLAHELRNPLATINGYVEGLADGVLQPSPVAWQALQTEMRRLGRLVDDLDAVSRAEERRLALHMTRVDPSALVEAAANAASPLYTAQGVELVETAPRGLPEVVADQDRLAEVLGNLLDNALRHTPVGGRVEISAARAGDRVELIVSDDGHGIRAEDLDRVFDRFYRADPSRARETGGSGIGLTIARAITEAHGGTIRAESEGRGKGSRFTVSLPAATQESGGGQRPS